MRVLLHTDATVLGVGFRQVLSAVPALEAHVVSGGADNLASAIARLRPAVVVIDFNGDFGGFGLAHLVKRHTGTSFVLWTHVVSLECAHNARELGIHGILPKDAPTDLLVRCLEKIGQGEWWFDQALLISLLRARQVRLSSRERQLLTLVSQGLSNKQVAAALSITEGTVKVYFSKLFRKVGVSDRFELALYGLRNQGLLSQVPDSRKTYWTATSVIVAQGIRPC